MYTQAQARQFLYSVYGEIMAIHAVEDSGINRTLVVQDTHASFCQSLLSDEVVGDHRVHLHAPA